jgi:hypothetical protein
MVSSNVNIFEMDYEATISYFICLENLDKIQHTYGAAPAEVLDNNLSFTSSVGVGPARKKYKVVSLL